ncbi:fad binding domain-containing protein [Cystoisospora suis]|uniref:Fad binding domain-containing protein n=1 Tax=Cystoisospora suis TaxID=483139 RepID=A0A2C6KM80_9APIC|nr:fad binding domain-containing protein [Cystoisospora suis]
MLKMIGPVVSRLPALSEAVTRSFCLTNSHYHLSTDGVIGASGCLPYASLTPGMEVPDCLVKITQILGSRRYQYGKRRSCLLLSSSSSSPPPAPPTYLYEILGDSHHVLLLHLLLLPPGSRVRNVFGCEMPRGPLAARYNSTCFNSLCRLARLSSLATIERGGGEERRQRRREREGRDRGNSRYHRLANEIHSLPTREWLNTVMGIASHTSTPRHSPSSKKVQMFSSSSQRREKHKEDDGDKSGDRRRKGRENDRDSSVLSGEGQRHEADRDERRNRDRSRRYLGRRSEEEEDDDRYRREEKTSPFLSSSPSPRGGGLRLVWCIHGSLATPHTTATPTSITTELYRGYSHMGSSITSHSGVSTASYLMNRFPSTATTATPTHQTQAASLGLGGISSRFRSQSFSFLRGLSATSLIPQGGEDHTKDKLIKDDPTPSSSLSKAFYSSTSFSLSPQPSRRPPLPASSSSSPQQQEGGLINATQSLARKEEEEKKKIRPRKENEDDEDEARSRRRSCGISSEEEEDEDEENRSNSIILLRRHILDLVPSELLAQVRSCTDGIASSSPSLLLVDFVQDISTKFGLNLLHPATSQAEIKSGAFTLIRPDGHVAHGGYAGDPIASRALLDYLINYF